MKVNVVLCQITYKGREAKEISWLIIGTFIRLFCCSVIEQSSHQLGVPLSIFFSWVAGFFLIIFAVPLSGGCSVIHSTY